MKSLLLPILLLITNFCLAGSETEYPASYYNEVGIECEQRNQLDEAIKNFKKALEINPNYSSAYVNLGIAYGKKGEYSDAIDNLERAEKLNPDLPEIYVNLGVIYEKLENYYKAVEFAQKAISLDGNNAVAVYNLGYAHVMRSNKELASEAYNRLKEMGQDNLAKKLLEKAGSRGLKLGAATVSADPSQPSLTVLDSKR